MRHRQNAANNLRDFSEQRHSEANFLRFQIRDGIFEVLLRQGRPNQCPGHHSNRTWRSCVVGPRPRSSSRKVPRDVFECAPAQPRLARGGQAPLLVEVRCTPRASGRIRFAPLGSFHRSQEEARYLLVLPWVTHSLVQPTERILPHTHLLVRSNRSKPHHLPHTYNACGSTMQENDRGR